MKKFIVIGLGSFGTNVAKSLAQKGNEVVAIDDDDSTVDKIKSHVSEAIVADATTLEVLTGIDVAHADAVIVGVGPNIESSILIVHLLKRLNVKYIVAKALSEEHFNILKIVGAHKVIYPEKDEAVRLANVLSARNLLDYIPLSEKYTLIEAPCPERFWGKTIKTLDIRKGYNLLIVGIKDAGKNGDVEIPDPDDVLSRNHTLFIIGTQQDIGKFVEGIEPPNF